MYLVQIMTETNAKFFTHHGAGLAGAPFDSLKEAIESQDKWSESVQIDLDTVDSLYRYSGKHCPDIVLTGQNHFEETTTIEITIVKLV